MNKTRMLLLGSVAAFVLVLGLLGATVASAQETTPDPDAPTAWQGGFGRGLFGGARGGGWTMLDAAAEALGLSPVELFTELHAGQTIDEVAEAQGVGVEAVQDATNAARAAAMREQIEQAVADGTMTQEQADWMLEGLEKGFSPMGRGFGPGRGRGWNCPQGE
jgi:hypothetical protein